MDRIKDKHSRHGLRVYGPSHYIIRYTTREIILVSYIQSIDSFQFGVDVCDMAAYSGKTGGMH